MSANGLLTVIALQPECLLQLPSSLCVCKLCAGRRRAASRSSVWHGSSYCACPSHAENVRVVQASVEQCVRVFLGCLTPSEGTCSNTQKPRTTGWTC